MGDDTGILTSHQIAAMVGVGSSQAGFQPLPLSPTLMRAVGSNPYTPQGGMAAQQLGAAALNALVSPQTPFLGSLTQGAMNRAQFMGNLGMVSHPGGGGPMGMGFGMAERQQIYQFAQQQGPKSLPGASMGELGQLIGMGSQMGEFTAVRSVQEFKQKFTQLLSAVKQVTQTLGTSLQEAMQLMSQVSAMGFSGGAGPGFLKQVQSTAYSAGMAPGAMLGAMAPMIAPLRQAGGMTQTQASNTAMKFMGTLGTAYESGILTDAQLMQSTGMGGQGGMEALMQSYLPRAAQRMRRGGRGSFLTAAMLDPETGGVDPNMISRLMSGGLSSGDVMGEGGRRAGQYGQANWTLNRGKLAGNVMEATGGLGEMMFYRGIMRQRGMGDLNDPRARLGLGRLMNASQEEVESFLPIMQNLDRIQAGQMVGGAQSRSAQSLSSLQGSSMTPGWMSGIQSRLKALTGKIEQKGDDISRTIEEAITDRFNNAIGRVEGYLDNDTISRFFKGELKGGMGRLAGGSAAPVGQDWEGMRKSINQGQYDAGARERLTGAMLAGGSGVSASRSIDDVKRSDPMTGYTLEPDAARAQVVRNRALSAGRSLRGGTEGAYDPAKIFSRFSAAGKILAGAGPMSSSGREEMYRQAAGELDPLVDMGAIDWGDASRAGTRTFEYSVAGRAGRGGIDLSQFTEEYTYQGEGGSQLGKRWKGKEVDRERSLRQQLVARDLANKTVEGGGLREEVLSFNRLSAAGVGFGDEGEGESYANQWLGGRGATQRLRDEAKGFFSAASGIAKRSGMGGVTELRGFTHDTPSAVREALTGGYQRLGDAISRVTEKQVTDLTAAGAKSGLFVSILKGAVPGLTQEMYEALANRPEVRALNEGGKVKEALALVRAIPDLHRGFEHLGATEFASGMLAFGAKELKAARAATKDPSLQKLYDQIGRISIDSPESALKDLQAVAMEVFREPEKVQEKLKGLRDIGAEGMADYAQMSSSLGITESGSGGKGKRERQEALRRALQLQGVDSSKMNLKEMEAAAAESGLLGTGQAGDITSWVNRGEKGTWSVEERLEGTKGVVGALTTQAEEEKKTVEEDKQAQKEMRDAMKGLAGAVEGNALRVTFAGYVPGAVPPGTGEGDQPDGVPGGGAI